MKQADLVRKLRRLARRTGANFHTLKTQGKGSHMTLFYGSRRSTCPHGELKIGTLQDTARPRTQGTRPALTARRKRTKETPQ